MQIFFIFLLTNPFFISNRGKKRPLPLPAAGKKRTFLFLFHFVPNYDILIDKNRKNKNDKNYGLIPFYETVDKVLSYTVGAQKQDTNT